MSATPRAEPYSRAFERILPSDREITVAGRAPAHEGPVYVPESNDLYFTTASDPAPTAAPQPGFRPRVEIQVLDLDTCDVRVWPRLTHMANGMTRDREGRLVICEQGDLENRARISRASLPDGEPETMVDGWWGLAFNSPNDVVVKRDGTIWFTDPSYGFQQSFKTRPQLGELVYRYRPDAEPPETRLEVVADGFSKPNGLAFSPDDSILYVTDSGAIESPGSYHVDLPHHVVAFDLVDGRRLANRRLFAVTTPGIPDGIKLDLDGNVYLGTGDGVQVFDPGGAILGKILIPGGVANFTFGGPDKNMLYMCAETVIYQVRLDAEGAGLYY